MEQEIVKLIKELERTGQTGLLNNKYEQTVNIWFVISELRRILQYSGKTIDVIKIEEESDLQAKYDLLYADYVGVLKKMTELQEKEISRLK